MLLSSALLHVQDLHNNGEEICICFDYHQNYTISNGGFDISSTENES